MHSIFEVTTPAASNILLTTAEAKAALGITTNSRDADVARLVSRVSSAIFRACKVRTDGINPPTLLSEEITETFRLENAKEGALLLSRRRVSVVTTFTEAGTELEAADYEVDRASGILMRLSSDEFTCWPQGKIVVEYTAGLTTVPDDLKLAAETWLRALWRDAYQTPSTINDPLVKREEIPGVRTVERWVNPTTETVLPPEIEAMLYAGGYIETWVG